MSPDCNKMTNEFTELQIARYRNQIYVEEEEEETFQIDNFKLTKSQVGLTLTIVKTILI